MVEKVADVLKKLAIDHEITILFAVESGRRAWGFESDDSDYDIRFIYMYNDRKKYLSLKPLKETIDGFSEDRLYDWNGWDITKALKLLHQINPSIVEWLYSPIVYYQDSDYNFLADSRCLVKNEQRILPLLYHYRSMAKSNFKTHIENKSLVKIKKYLYVIRPAGMLEWLLKCKRDGTRDLVEIDFNRVLKELATFMSAEVSQNIDDIIKKKKIVKEMDEEPRVECLDKWIEGILSYNDEDFKKYGVKDGEKKTLDEYDNVLHSLLKIKF